MASSSLSAAIASFREKLSHARRVLVLTGAGVSAESGIPTFRGAGGLWRTYRATDLATPQAFSSNPSLVWEFYHYRREVVLGCRPNRGHQALARAEQIFTEGGRKWTLVTQNIDGLHAAAGSRNIVELHGNLFKTRCTKCLDVRTNRDRPICPALAGRGAPDPNANGSPIPTRDLPQCVKCKELLRPHIVWFGESLYPSDLLSAEQEVAQCDFCLVVGTSAVVYPAAGFVQEVVGRGQGVPVAEVNLERTPSTDVVDYYFEGKSGDLLPQLLDNIRLK